MGGVGAQGRARGPRGAWCFHRPGLKRQPRLFEQKLLVVFNDCNILQRCDSKLDVLILQQSSRMTDEDEVVLREALGSVKGPRGAPSVTHGSS